jgi:riboflavin biosynthesis pyrimidine reductase
VSDPLFRQLEGAREPDGPSGPAPVEALLDAVVADAVAPVPGRPRTVGVMVASVDGHAAVNGRSGPLGGPEDRAVFRGLRSRADALLVGSGTLNAERYSTTLDPPHRREREAAGLPPEPLLATITRSFALAEDLPLLHEPLTRAVVYTETTPPYAVDPSHVDVVQLPAATPRAALEDLARRGVARVNCEGGPSLLAALARDEVLDELLVTVSPLLVGGDDALTMLRGELGRDGRPLPMTLRGVWRGGDVLFLHYHLIHGSPA